MFSVIYKKSLSKVNLGNQLFLNVLLMRFQELQQLPRMFVCDCIILFVLQRVNRMLHLQCIMVSGIVSHVLSSR